jgi:hypothetical protein
MQAKALAPPLEGVYRDSQNGRSVRVVLGFRVGEHPPSLFFRGEHIHSDIPSDEVGENIV